MLPLSARGRRLLGRECVLGVDAGGVVPLLDVFDETNAVDFLAGNRVDRLVLLNSGSMLVRRGLFAGFHAQIRGLRGILLAHLPCLCDLGAAVSSRWLAMVLPLSRISLCQLLAVHVCQFLLELRQHYGVAGILQARIRCRVPMHRSILEELTLLVVKPRRLSRGRQRLARHERLKLLTLPPSTRDLRLQVRRCLQLRQVVDSSVLADLWHRLRAHNLAMLLDQTVIGVVGQVEHAVSVLRHYLGIIHRHSELLVPRFLPLASYGLDHGRLLERPTGAKCLILLAILRLLEVRVESIQIWGNQRTRIGR